MGLRQWCRRVWNRIRGRSVNDEAPQNAVEEEFTELTAEPAPEPAPDQRTSDEVIEEMAASQVEAYENCDNRWHRLRKVICLPKAQGTRHRGI